MTACPARPGMLFHHTMHHKRKLICVLLLSAVFVSTSCSKYEEGPWLSFTKKENRIRGFWELCSISKNGENTNETPSDVESKEGTWEFYHTHTLLITYYNGASTLKSEGSWEFSENKENLDLHFTTRYASLDRSYEIVKLTTKEMKLRYVDKAGDRWILTFSILQSFNGYAY